MLSFARGARKDFEEYTAFVAAGEVPAVRADADMPDRVFREHLDQLANVHGIRVTYLDRRSGEWPHAHPLRQPPEVVTFEPTDRRRYLCGLHEIGHLLGDFARTHTLVERCGPGVDLVEEADAWDWALNATRVDVSTTDVNYILELLQHDAVGHGAAHAFGVDLVPGHLSDRYGRPCSGWSFRASASALGRCGATISPTTPAPGTSPWSHPLPDARARRRTTTPKRQCPVCGASLAGRRRDAESAAPRAGRERSRLRALLTGEGAGPYATLAESQARRRRTREAGLHAYAEPL